MDLESECSVLESVEDNEEIVNGSVSENLGIASESKVQNNGSYVVENNDNNELFPELRQRVVEVTRYAGSPPMDLKPEDVSSLHTSVRKGHGLRKWRRIRRDSNRDGDSSIDTDRMMVVHDLPNSGVKPSKRMQYSDGKQKSEGSVSSTKAVVRNMDGFALLDDSGVGLGSPFAAGTDSENSEGQSSKSSTAASAPRIKNEIPMFMGSPRDKSMMRSLSGKILAHNMQRGRQEKGWTESTKKARGERVKIEKENSHSSLESDSRSSNFVFMQGTYPVNNGMPNERPNDYDEGDSDEVLGSRQQINDGYGKDGEGGYGDSSPVAGSSSKIREKRTENHCSITEQDPLDESISALHSAQEALEKEVLKFKEIGNSASVDGSISDLCAEFTDEEQILHKRRGEQSQGGEGFQSFSRTSQSEVVETANEGAITELEDLFKQKVEAEVEFLAISRAVQKLRVAAGDHITVLEEQKALASEQTQILDKLGEAENKAAVLQKDANKLEKICEDIASADELLKLQKRVGKYRSCFLMQLVLFVVILAIFASRFSSDHIEIVPT
ncbi:hypothetical protein ACS0TY_032401 [Phlomoides rotata]